MPTFKFEAMDATGLEIRDQIIAENEEEACQKIKKMGYFVTRILCLLSREEIAEQTRAVQGNDVADVQEARSRKLLGWLCLIGLFFVGALSLYLCWFGVWVMLVGGIYDAIDLIKADTRTKTAVAVCVFRILLFEIPIATGIWIGIIGGGGFLTLTTVFFTGKSTKQKMEKQMAAAFRKGLR